MTTGKKVLAIVSALIILLLVMLMCSRISASPRTWETADTEITVENADSAPAPRPAAAYTEGTEITLKLKT